MKNGFSRRHFVGGAAAALGALGLRPGSALGALKLPPPPSRPRPARPIRPAGQALLQREPVRPVRQDDGVDERGLEVLEPVRLPRRGHPREDRRAPRPGHRPHHHERGFGRDAQGGRHRLPRARGEGGRRRAHLHERVPGGDGDRCGRDRAAAAGRSHPGHRRSDPGHHPQLPRRRPRLHRQPQQPDRRGRPRLRHPAPPRQHPRGHPRADRRGIPPLRAGSAVFERG